ncbi:hypothetical protein C8A01DRAFT_17437 [Parachaetomium inaequale]|uniref:Uncharacterized protein n=1 Tax=Parachaetomium inaequale TaxID=2588326 RepID=A0AAN6SQ66_9PEZI|nr:hypothetical protein C8A01DRAFT_17437 [Parachaetomium inaequale]
MEDTVTTSDGDTPPASENSDSNPTTTGNAKGRGRPSVQQQIPGSSADYDYYDDESDDDDDDEYASFNEYDRFGQEWGIIDLRMLPKRGTPECPAAPWAAVLEVKCRDVPRLMREGFFWSAENVLREEGHMSWETRPEWTALGCRYKRTWILADRPNHEARRWVGRLEVVSPLLELLPDFQVLNLSRENVYAAAATNALQQWIYNFDYRFPRHNYNCIYGNKPLKGWWPWPTEEGSYNTAFPDVDAGELFPHPPVTWSRFQGRELGGWYQQPTSCVIQ